MDCVANSSISSRTPFKTRLKLLSAAIFATALFAFFGTPESLKPPSKFQRWIDEQVSVQKSGSDRMLLDPSTKFFMIIRSPDGSLRQLQMFADKTPQQTQRLVELAHESGLFTDDKSEELRKDSDTITPIEQLNWEGHIFFEVDGAGLVFRRAINKKEISDNIAAQNLIRLFKFYAEGELGPDNRKQTEEKLIMGQ